MARENKVSERHVIEAFHVLARESLSEAQQDGLIDDAFLQEATAEELQVLGPACKQCETMLCRNELQLSFVPDTPVTLLFAAWKNVADPPSVNVPPSDAHPAFLLSVSTCPTNMLPLFRRWQRTVPSVQKLSTEQAHDVARLICDLEPETSPVSTLMVKLAADIQAIAIQISQRRTFMERYTQDLEMALHRRSPSFNRPPNNRPELQAESSTCYGNAYPQDGPNPFADTPPPVPPRPSRTDRPPSIASQSDGHLQPQSPIPETHDENVIAIRETLYAVLADVISQSNTLGSILREDPARGYFTAVALAVVEASTNCLTPDGHRVRLVTFGPDRPTSFGSLDAPPAYRVFVRAIVGMGAVLRDLQEKDNDRAIELAMSGQDDTLSLTRIEMLKEELENGPPDSDSIHEGESQRLRQTAELRTIANQINRMALAVTSLPGFQSRVGVFEILQGVSSNW